MLKPAGDDGALLLWTKPEIDINRYKQIIIDPIVVYPAPKRKLADLPPAKTQALVDYFYAVLKKDLSEVFVLTDKPATDTLRLRVALAEAKASSPVRDLISNVLPYGIALTALKSTATGTHTAVGETQAEVELLDSVSGERIAAAVDARAGSKSLRGKFDKWDDVKSAFDYWSGRMRDRFLDARQDASGRQ